LIKPAQIEEWMQEVKERPESASLIIQFITDRLRELSEKNEDLLAENISLKRGEKVADYESRISNLEYQLEMLKRQVGDAVEEQVSDQINLLIYDTNGRIIRFGLDYEGLISADVLAKFSDGDYFENKQGKSAGEIPPNLLAIPAKEELLFVFDSGRSVSMPLSEIPLAGRLPDGVNKNINWQQAYIQEPRGGETLVAVLPIARMALFEYCIQASRRGYIKKIRESFLETCIAKANIGSGVLVPYDKTFRLALCGDNDMLVLVSQDGHLLCTRISHLPYSVDEIIRLKKSDHLVSAFILRDETSLLVVTQNGKAFHRDRSWLEPEDGSKEQKRAILTKARRDSGTRIIASAAVEEQDWGFAITTDGSVRVYQMGDVLNRGALLDSTSELNILSFALLRDPSIKAKKN